MPPVPASVASATVESVPIDVRAVGTVEPSITVQIKSQIAGELFKVDFTEGADVEKGDLLFEIDARPYQDALNQANAALARDEALLHQAEANLARDSAQAAYADTDAARTDQLMKQGVIAKSQADQSKSTSDALRQSMAADRAAIESARATVESDRASISTAKLNLSYCEIRSPVSGRAGNLLVHLGNLVKVNDVALVVINRLTPIYVSFGVPASQLGAIRANSGIRKLLVQVSLQDDPRKAEKGELTVIDNTVDTNTGTIHLKATFANEHRLLWPGEFVDVSMTLGTSTNAIVIPTEAIQAGQQGQFVYVVKADGSVEPRDVTVGQTVGRKAIIQTGIAGGETVVTDGQLRLFPGAHIQAVPASKVDSQKL
jgi:multidrug efflux system membrane fusion protein